MELNRREEMKDGETKEWTENVKRKEQGQKKEKEEEEEEEKVRCSLIRRGLGVGCLVR